jgi:hypothetical protein
VFTGGDVPLTLVEISLTCSEDEEAADDTSCSPTDLDVLDAVSDVDMDAVRKPDFALGLALVTRRATSFRGEPL